MLDLVAYIGIALLLGAGGGYTLAAAGLRFRLPVTWNPNDSD
jgi:hypothetical protein